ncbi:MAG: hypothetical protein PHC88_13495 [Terrimicrobiaceae bacterium]|nr:hypothetical protein [Terrimicrobiaceae bacterium]
MFPPTRHLPRLLAASLVLASLCCAPREAAAASLAAFKGKYTGVLIISQGATTRLLGNANFTVKATAKSAKIVIKGSINSVAFTQTLRLAHGTASLSTLLPGIASFNQSTTGSYKVRGKGASISAPLPDPYSGTLGMALGFTTFGKTLTLSSQLVFSDGSAPVYVTIIGG